MQILELIDRLDNLVYEARPVPFASAVRLDRDEVFQLLDQMRVLVADHFSSSTRERAAKPGRLEEVAKALEDGGRAVPAPLTAVASDQVREVVRAAEDTAEKIRTEARRDAELVAADVAEKRAAADAIRAEADDALASAREQREAARAQVEEIVAQAERIRSEATRSAAALARDQLDRMEASARELAAQVAAAEALGPAVGDLRNELEGLRRRIREADEPTRALRSVPPSKPDAALEPDGLPQDAEPVEAARIAGA